MRILVTGASGFVGQSLIKALKQRDADVVGVGRQLLAAETNTFFAVPDFTDQKAWQTPLKGCGLVIHLAARVHVMNDDAVNALAEFRKANVIGTQRLAESAAKAGIKRFVYVSSIGVNGSQTLLPYTELDKPNPHGDYAHSKWEAEQVLHEIALKTGLEIVIIRPPLVYGFAAPGNFAQMIKVLAKGVPLPFANAHNLRSLIYVENLVDSLVLCATHPDAAGNTYLVSDGEDISMSNLLVKLGEIIGKPTILFPFPHALLRLVGRLVGKSNQVNQLLGSLQVDSSKIRRELGWQPPFTLSDGLMSIVGTTNDK